MKICLVTHKLKKGDGQGRVNFELAKSLYERGHKLTLVSSEIDPELIRAEIKWIKIDTSRINNILLSDVFFSLLSYIKIVLAKEKKHEYMIVNGFITWKSSNLNVVHFVHSAWLKSPYHPWYEKKSLWSFYQYVFSVTNSYLEKIAFKNTRKLVAVSHKVAEELIKIGVAREKIEVILNGVDTEEFYPDYDRKSDELKICFAGDIINSRKNLITVIRAMEILPKELRLKLYVAGESRGSIYPEIVKQMGLNEKISFAGFTIDMPGFFREMDVMAFPSRYEACSLALLEALSSGLAVITSRSTGGCEVIEQMAGNIIESSEDYKSISSKIEKYYDDANKLMSDKRKSREIALGHSWSEMSKRYINIIEN